MEIRYEEPTYHASIAEVRGAAASLSSLRSRASASVSELLDSWHGEAATEFAAAWQDWWSSAGDVAAALYDLADLLTAYRASLLATDAGSSTAMDLVAGRLS